MATKVANKTQYFKSNGQNSRIDEGGNHFVNGKCVNPKSYEGNIRDTYPEVKDRLPAITKAGFVPHKIVEDKFVLI